jgi:hypothetical protein
MAELIVPPALRAAHQRGLAHYLETGEGPVIGRTVELPALRADGAEFPVEIAITPVAGEATPLFTASIRERRGDRRSTWRSAPELLRRFSEREALLQEIHHRARRQPERRGEPDPDAGGPGARRRGRGARSSRATAASPRSRRIHEQAAAREGSLARAVLRLRAQPRERSRQRSARSHMRAWRSTSRSRRSHCRLRSRFRAVSC